MSSAAQYLGYVLLSFGLANYLFRRIPVCARKEQVDFPDEMVWMGIMGYQAVTVEMVQRVRKACQVHLDHVVLKEKQVWKAWQVHLDHVVLKEYY